MKKTAAYIRVSTRQQNASMQERAIREWAKAKGVKLKFYRDEFTGRTMDRPGWNQLEADLFAGKLDRVITWKLDRLGRTVSGLTKLFDDLQERGVPLLSLTEGFDLTKPMGKLIANVMVSLAEYETELRGERVQAGQAAARARGVTWGGSKAGWTKLSKQQMQAVLRLHESGTSKRGIASMMGLSWPTVSKFIELSKAGNLPTPRGC